MPWCSHSPPMNAQASPRIILQAGMPPATCPSALPSLPSCSAMEKGSEQTEMKIHNRGSGSTGWAIGSYWLFGMKLFFSLVRCLCPYKQAIEERLICSQLLQLGACPWPGRREGTVAPGFFLADPQCPKSVVVKRTLSLSVTHAGHRQRLCLAPNLPTDQDELSSAALPSGSISGGAKQPPTAEVWGLMWAGQGSIGGLHIPAPLAPTQCWCWEGQPALLPSLPASHPARGEAGCSSWGCARGSEPRA